jgi:hypothetical protein
VTEYERYCTRSWSDHICSQAIPTAVRFERNALTVFYTNAATMYNGVQSCPPDSRRLACRRYSAVDITLHEGSSRTDRTYQHGERERRVCYSVLCCSSGHSTAKYPPEPDESKAHECTSFFCRRQAGP